MKAQEILSLSKIIPVVSVDDELEGLNLAKALYEGGIEILELTLRTPKALDILRALIKEFPRITVGAGTVISTNQLQRIKDLGASFAISPGINATLAKKALELDLAFIPGVSSPSDILLALEFELKALKFFPATQIGGVPMLKALNAPFKEVKFCPTGGINLENAKEYLALDNVLCVGGSWLCDKELIRAKKWQELTRLAKKSLAHLNS
ncbi:bifunctional 4-hydroxy-2-oxoglutarate aldolase/2-dehydro-3-deoxy-phosphogluconate aldolase [Campylobacter troglodytis]|uniref:bifunctional 4-hydroxy-2-oxoglutarate aldolase/2-dehydro-3-deoxy-phosphogluconate aldolase n=1 Tax=Campylobacter troglodytis TaxID=654363 RepID=UPI00115BD96E|nr:bifunctional 4-hydroxy-2-oxoglutarate aldolase/2-dehydro-3-deoxy-phosphogluconate aldolase [Campylobacter troglodytis]TQR60399.1 keto-deoxy-phosphogluconate aldolase [Campylobacter troglodytis]